MPLKTFLQDLENCLDIRPVGIKNSFFRGVVAKLRDTARKALGRVDMNSIETLKNTLEEYFSPKKHYLQYCAEIMKL